MKKDFEKSMNDYITRMLQGQKEIQKWWDSYLPPAIQNPPPQS